MIKEIGIFEMVNEHDLDYMMLEEFWASADFCAWFLDKTMGNHDGIKFSSARHSYRFKSKNANSKTNQTDIRADFVDQQNKKLIFLIENKIGHSLTDRQIDGYKAVKERMAKEENAKVETVLFAPEVDKYSNKKNDFDQFVSYERFREFLVERSLADARYVYKLELLDWAVNKCRRLGIQKRGEEKPIKFRREYSRIFSELAPELNCSFLEDATSQSLFFNFKPNGFSQLGLTMRHKARPQHSTLDVEFPYEYNLEVLEKYRQSLADCIGLPVEWVIVRMAGKSPAIGVMVPGVDVNEDFNKQELKIVCIAKTANKFYQWIVENIHN